MARQQRAIETRESIVVAAARVFAEGGYRASTLSDVTREAQVTQGAIYFHFGSKRELAAEIIRRQHETSLAAGEQQLKESESGAEGMVALSATLAEQIVRNPIVQAGLRLSTESVDDLADVAAVPYLDWIATCRQFLERAADGGELRAGLDLDAAAEVVISSFTGVQFVAAAVANGADLIERLERMWLVLLPALLSDGKTIDPQRVKQLLTGAASG